MVDKQISLFYGPISALLKEHDVIRHKIFQMIGRHCIFDDKHPTLDSLSDSERKIWTHFFNVYKLPINHQIIEIIRQNNHLIHDSRIPNCFAAYMEYVLGWELLDSQYKNDVPIDYEYLVDEKFPYDFVDYIEFTLKHLLQRQRELSGDCMQIVNH